MDAGLGQAAHLFAGFVRRVGIPGRLSFRILGRDVGRWMLRLTGLGRSLSDAMEKRLRVVPDGRAVVASRSDFLGETETLVDLEIPETTIPGSQTLLVKLYPGPMASAVEGLENIVRMPYG